MKVSAFQLAEAVHRLDADAIYVLVMLRNFNSSWASLLEDDIENLEEWNSDVDSNESAKRELVVVCNSETLTGDQRTWSFWLAWADEEELIMERELSAAIVN